LKANFHRPRSTAAQSHASILLHSNAGCRSVVPHAPVPIDNLSHAAIPRIGSACITNRGVSQPPAPQIAWQFASSSLLTGNFLLRFAGPKSGRNPRVPPAPPATLSPARLSYSIAKAAVCYGRSLGRSRDSAPAG
jgi:hypothetical protein